VCSARPPKGTDDSPEDEAKGSYLPDVLRRRLAEATVLALYFAFEFPNSWHESHERALIQLVVGLSAVTLIEFRVVVWGCISVLLAVSAYGYYLYKGPTPPEETETHGYLLPSNYPTPTTNCLPGMKGMMFILGGNISKIDDTISRLVVLQVDDTPLVAVERSGDKLVFDSYIFDKNDVIVAAVDRGEFHLKAGQYFYSTRSDDRSDLVVYDNQRHPVLHIFYANPTTVFITGVFYSEKGTKVVIDDTSIEITPWNIRSNCIIDFGLGISSAGLFQAKRLPSP